MSNYRRYFSDNKTMVFLTFVTYNRRNILLENIDVFKNSLKFAKTKHDFEIIAITVMKNHCHLIISPQELAKVPQIIKTIKFNFSVNIPEKFLSTDLSESAIKRGEKGIWQRRYYDHIIRDEKDLHRHIDYIHYNSYKHYQISPKDWEFSSFKSFVNKDLYEINWCNLEDKNSILDLDLE